MKVVVDFNRGVILLSAHSEHSFWLLGMTNLIESRNGGPSYGVLPEEDPDAKPPPWHASVHPISSYAELSDFGHISEDREISREEIENSIRKFEELSKQLEERSSQALLDDNTSDDRRMSMDEDINYTNGNPLSASFDDLHPDPELYHDDHDNDHEHAHDPLEEHPLSEEERSKSDGETEALIAR